MKKTTKILSLIMAIVIFGTFTLSSFASPFQATGVDVSYWQKDIDFKSVKASGIDFAILRIGTSYGKDSMFEKNYENAKKAGIDVGCYFYTYALTVNDAVKEAKDVISWIGNKTLEYPIYFDIEDSSLESLSKAEKMNIIDAFVSAIENAGFLPGLYVNYNWLKYHLDSNTVKEKYDLWLASWTDSGKPDADKSSECKMWQYSASGTVDGISGGVDMDISYFDYPTYVKVNGYNNYAKPAGETDDNPIGTETDNLPGDYFKVLKTIFARLMETVKIIAKLLGLA